jgi:hypothetical protein
VLVRQWQFGAVHTIIRKPSVPTHYLRIHDHKRISNHNLLRAEEPAGLLISVSRNFDALSFLSTAAGLICTALDCQELLAGVPFPFKALI